MRLFLDTNVLLDVLMRRVPFYSASAAVWTSVESGRHLGGVSAISFNNAYYLLRRSAGEAEARKAISMIRKIFDVVPLDGPLIDSAISSTLKDFEDAIQWASAGMMRADYLLTRNERDFPTVTLKVVCPEIFLAFDAVSS